MNNEIIKSFLVGLGFDVDESSLKAFNKSIKDITLKIAGLYGSIKVTTAAVAFGISKISESFEDLGYEYRLIAPAINKALILRREMLKAYSAVGLNLTKVVQSAVRLNLSITKTKYALDAIYKSVGARFFELLTKQSDIFREKLYRNIPRIQNVLESFVRFIFKAFEGTVILGERMWSILSTVYDFFVKLDHATDGWSTKILGFIAIWKLLNLSFLLTPLGRIIALGFALLTLYDDLKTFKEGGNAFINWGSETTKMLTGLISFITAAAIAWKAISFAVGLYTNATKLATAAQWLLNVAMDANPIGLIITAIVALITLLTVLDKKWDIFSGKLSGFFSGIGGKILNFITGTKDTSIASIPKYFSGINGLLGPAGSSDNSRSFNQNFKQETTIQVNGSADAHSIAGKLNDITYQSYGYAFSNLQRYTRRQIQ